MNDGNKLLSSKGSSNVEGVLLTKGNPSASQVNETYVPQKPTKDTLARWGHLTTEQLNGAQYALRVLHTSPVITGRGLAVLKATWAEICDVMLVRGLHEGRDTELDDQ